jgi:hypothetical protein
MQGAYVPLKRRPVPEPRTGCPDLLWIDLVPVLAEDGVTVAKGQVVREQVKVPSEQRLGVVFSH